MQAAFKLQLNNAILKGLVRRTTTALASTPLAGGGGVGEGRSGRDTCVFRRLPARALQRLTRVPCLQVYCCSALAATLSPSSRRASADGCEGICWSRHCRAGGYVGMRGCGSSRHSIRSLLASTQTLAEQRALAPARESVCGLCMLRARAA
eukprot:6194432-Pleurochrysis_carterae.AAC.3